MGITINTPGWRIRSGGSSRGLARGVVDPLPGLPPWALTTESEVAEEHVLEPAASTRALDAGAGQLDLSFDLPPGQAAILAIRHPSQALTFHRPIESTSRGARTIGRVRFQVPLQRVATRGLVNGAVKAILVKVAKIAGDKVASLLLPRLAAAVETAAWAKRGLSEGWFGITPDALAAGKLVQRTPVSPARSLLLLHGTFSDAASAFQPLALPGTSFFDRVAGTYGDRVFAFNHFTISKTPEENARLLLQGLPDQKTVFDVVTHSRGGLVLRTLVEQSTLFGSLAGRFSLGRAVLVASPNDGTPLATAKRWDETIGWVTNVLELFPDNPFTTGAEFVANGLVWIANHATGDLPGLHAMDADSQAIEALQGAPQPPENAYSALVSNYQPSTDVLQRLIDAGIDQFFASANDLVVPSEGGWRVDRSTRFVPADRIGCFGPGGNLPRADVTHVAFFKQPESADFLVNGLLGQPQHLPRIDPQKALPDRRLIRRDMVDAPAQPILSAGPSPRAARTSAAPHAVSAPLDVTVVNGDLTFESDPLLLGHYRASRLTGTEAVMNRALGGTMQRSLQAGVYPDGPGTHQIFVNTNQDLERGMFLPRPKAVIVAGLGDEGTLHATDLVDTVRQAVIAWAQRQAEQGVSGKIALVATLLGSGGTGVGAGDAARSIVQGVLEANDRIAQAFDARAPHVGALRLIELYLERAAEAWRAISLQAKAQSDRFVLVGPVHPGTGSLVRQPSSSYRGAEFDFVTVETRREPDGTPSIAYTLDTKRARSEVRAQRTQRPLVRELVRSASNEFDGDTAFGRTLFNLLVPPELDAYLVGHDELQISLDPQTAQIPWELLDTTREDPAGAAPGTDDSDLPWAIRVKLIRKLRLGEFRERVRDATSEANVLVVGEPDSDGPRLFGARNEALAVAKRLTDGGASVVPLISADQSVRGDDAKTIVNTLFSQPWRIVHIAGHGQPAADGKPGGVVLSHGTFLGPEEIQSLRTVPALVFLNCCHLAQTDGKQLLETYDRAEFAAGVAGALIGIGVRCVVAAGWAVDDVAAQTFADAFYASLLDGERFIEAIGKARAAAYQKGGNTWAAYQCYGDADWTFTKSGSQIAAPSDPAMFPSPVSMSFALEQIAVQSQFQGKDPAVQRQRLDELVAVATARGWHQHGDIAELFGAAFLQSGSLAKAREWYQTATSSIDGRATLKAGEQLANVQCRLAWERVDTAARHRDTMRARLTGGKGTRSQRTAAGRALKDAEAAVTHAAAEGNREIDSAVALLRRLVAFSPTMERESLLGSAYKRRVLIHTVTGRRDMRADLRQMQMHYAAAEAIGRSRQVQDRFYPGANRLAAEIAVNAGRRGWSIDRRQLTHIKALLAEKRGSDFWGVAGEIEVAEYEALSRRRLRRVAAELTKAYERLHDRVAGARLWGSVYDNGCLVLSSYARRASDGERAAALRLLDLLRTFAYPESS